jgi:peptidoglycan/LPS O-acetylase OafA/YrhL
MVCFFHLYCGNSLLFPGVSGLKSIFSYGYLGVFIFFMISGLIICYSLPVDYHFKQFKVFILKRVIRIEPPYVASILLILLLNYWGANFTHIPVKFAWTDFLFHFAYLNNFGLGQYYNVVYWTLGIEFQFYLIISSIFKIINNSNTGLIIVMLLFVVSSFLNVKNMNLIFSHLPIFGLGILTFFYFYKKQIPGQLYGLLCVIFLAELYFYISVPEFWSSLFTLAIFFFWKLRHGIFDFFSNISFSLYLTHTTIGGKVINLGLRFAKTDTQHTILFVLALIISILFAFVFYLMIEKPFIRLSKKLLY